MQPDPHFLAQRDELRFSQCLVPLQLGQDRLTAVHENFGHLQQLLLQNHGAILAKDVEGEANYGVLFVRAPG